MIMTKERALKLRAAIKTLYDPRRASDADMLAAAKTVLSLSRDRQYRARADRIRAVLS